MVTGKSGTLLLAVVGIDIESELISPCRPSLAARVSGGAGAAVTLAKRGYSSS